MMTLAQAHALLPASTLVGNGATALLRVHSDTRTLQAGDLFVALRGERFDANAFLAEAKAKGEEAVKTKIDGMQKAWTKARDAFIAEHPDYEEIAESDDLIISKGLAAALLRDPKDGVKLSYWLGKNPDEAERLSQLSPADASYELGRISERLEAKPAREPKPKPINPLNSKLTTMQVVTGK